MIETRVVRIKGQDIDTIKTVTCPFCGRNVLIGKCRHLKKTEQPEYRNTLNGKYFGNFSYWFTKDLAGDVNDKTQSSNS